MLDDELSVRIVRCKHMGPEIEVLSLDEVLGLESIEVVLVGDIDELEVALSVSEGFKGKVGVSSESVNSIGKV